MQSKAPEQDQDDIDTGHPLNRHVRSGKAFLERLSAHQDMKDLKGEQLAAWKESINRLASTNDGQLFIKTMLVHSGLFAPGSVANANAMMEQKIRATFYNAWVRPFLNKQLRTEVEP
jgi:hypothetical protein